MKRLTFIGLLLLATGFGACKKEAEGPSLTELITATPWRMVASLTETPGYPTSDAFPLMKACDKDNKYVFLADSSYLQLEGPTRCNAADPEVKSKSTWQLINDGKVLKLGITENNVVVISKDSLIVQRKGSFNSMYIFKFSPY